MATVDSVSVFAEGTFEEQIQELADYATRSSPEDEHATALQSFRDIIKLEEPIEKDQERRRKALTFVLDQTKSLGDGSEQGYFNLLFSHLLTLWPTNSPEIKHYVSSLLGVLASSPSEHSSVRYRVLSNLFNATPRNSALRLSIYTTLLQLAAANGELETLRLSRKDNGISLGKERSHFLKSIGQSAAIDAIALALRLPSLFDFDPLFKVGRRCFSTRSRTFHRFCRLFLNSGLPEFRSWLESHPTNSTKHSLSRRSVFCHLRHWVLHTFGHDLPYSEVASVLQIELSQVEKWAIDGIDRTGLLSGKLSQTTQSIRIYRSSARTRLVAWKAGLASVLEVVTSAQKRGNGSAVSEVVQQVTQTGESVKVDAA
ncbi:PCI-domain-containing protein [Suillus subalutaceus]|uniref:PCI-domain-containing protein n=1 Tax=Suillus subalutaceus TaxID=48586 RepID=UPI001B885448|nr:PCI-domain-containing protein [Suillus subalutaceus]KAG1867291.1 PCI-domain-containing protein [Suillus subalutaceus]